MRLHYAGSVGEVIAQAVIRHEVYGVLGLLGLPFGLAGLAIACAYLAVRRG